MDDQTPATRADLQTLERSMKTDLQTLERSMNARFERVDAKFERVHGDINRVLDVLVNIDHRLKDKLEDHEERIVRLEKTLV